MKGFIDLIYSEKRIAWNKKVQNTRLDDFRKTVEKKYNLNFDSYFDLHEWSVKHYDKFWETLWNYFGVTHSEPYQQVAKRGNCILETEWFIGAKLNYAENLLRHRDNRTALLCLDEEGNEEQVTYAQLFEQTKLYAAALRKFGVKKGDRVACYMSHRKEAFFAMLGAASIGAIFGGPNPFFGSQAASDILNIMKPSVLFAVDRMRFNGTEFRPMNNLAAIAENVPSLEKVIIVPTKPETLKKDISGIKNSCFLEEFLKYGRNPDGSVPEITFEQLPFSHPVCINFTSGTTGVPKGLMHNMAVILGPLRDFGLHCNLNSNDVVLTLIPVGWGIWFLFNANLILGNTMIIYDGNPIYLKPPLLPFWDFVEKFKISYLLLETCEVDKMEKVNIVPSENCDLSKLKMINVTASPVKPQNIQFLIEKVKKDIAVGSFYGCTETKGLFSGFDLNLPIYSGEIQVPSLGTDLRCLDENGQSLIGAVGELVIGSPLPTLPVAIWNDSMKRTLKDLYLSRQIDGFNVSDKAWFDPDTKGFVVIGRSDDVIKQGFERFACQDIYSAIHDMDELADYICIPQTNAKGIGRAVLFVKLKSEIKFSSELVEKISKRIEERVSAFHIPEIILETKDIPYNFNGKKLEKLVKIIVATQEIPQHSNAINPECLPHYLHIPELENF